MKWASDVRLRALNERTNGASPHLTSNHLPRACFERTPASILAAAVAAERASTLRFLFLPHLQVADREDAAHLQSVVRHSWTKYWAGLRAYWDLATVALSLSLSREQTT